MAIIKAVNSRASIATAINYVTKNEKTEEKLITSIGCSPQTAIEEMKTTKALWDKADGRQYKHIVQSFSPDEKITPQQAHEIAQKLCADQFKGYEILIATHKDREHVHTHIIINSVSYEDGRKFQQSRQDLQALKDRSDELCIERGLSITHKGDEITAYTKDKYKVLEKAINGKYKSYVLDCFKVASTAKESATSRGDFIEKMRAVGWKTSWTDRKYITFTNKDGNKVRNSNLEKTFKEPFDKEDLQHGFESNLERANAHRIAEQSRGLTADKGTDRTASGSPAEDTDLAIDKLNSTIGKSKTEISRDDRAKANRIVDEQSRKSERDRIEKQEAHEYHERSRGISR